VVLAASYRELHWPPVGDSCSFFIFVHNGVFGKNFGSRHARKSIKGSIDAEDCLVSKKSLNHKNGPLDRRSGGVKVGQKFKKCFLCDVTKRNPHPNQILFFKSKLKNLLNPWMV